MKKRKADGFAQIAEETKEALCERVDDFFEQSRQGCCDYDSFITMEKLEDAYLDMMARSQASYLDMIGRTLSSIDETKLLELKKENAQETASR